MRPDLNAVVVTLDPTSGIDARQSLTAKYGESGLSFAPDAPPQVAAQNPRWNPPIGSHAIGGKKLVNQAGKSCSLNISVKDSANNWYGVTAGHCFNVGGAAIAFGNSDNYLTNTYNSAKFLGTAQPSQVVDGGETTCDCRVIGPISAGLRSQNTLVNGNTAYTYSWVVANSNSSWYSGSPIACQNGFVEYATYGHIICGPVDSPSSDRIICGDFCYVLADAFHVAYPSGEPSIKGDSGSSVGSGTTLLGTVATVGGYASKTANLRNVYTLVTWIVPGH